MKDNWIKPFQDRLGDYELDVPVPARVPYRRRVLPWLSAAAAAAAVALLLILPGRRNPDPRQPERFIAELSPQLHTPLPGMPVSLLQRSRPSRDNIAQPGETATPESEPAAVTTGDNPPAPDKPEEIGRERQKEDQPVPTNDPDASVTADGRIPWQGDGEAVRNGKGRSWSAKVFAGNFQARESGFQNTDDLPAANAVSPAQNDAPKAVMNYAAGNAYHFDNYTDLYRSNETPVRETVCDLPLKAGLAIRYDVSARIGIESGLTYSYHHAKQSFSGNLAGSYYRDFRMHYIGIPLKASFKLTDWKQTDLYVNLGGEAELMATGRIITIDGVTQNSVAIQEHPVQFSLTGAAGAEYLFNQRIGLYAEPGISWHPEPSGTLPSYYRDHPWSFDLRIGLRFRLN